MKALSLMEPWASLVAWGYKRVETRSWGVRRALWGVPLAIHASKSTEAVKDVGYVEGLFEEGAQAMPDWWPRRKEDYPLGGIVALTGIRESRPMDDALIGQQSQQEIAFGAWAPGRHAIFFGDVRRLPEAVPCRGALGIWNVPDELQGRVLARSA